MGVEVVVLVTAETDQIYLVEVEMIQTGELVFILCFQIIRNEQQQGEDILQHPITAVIFLLINILITRHLLQRIIQVEETICFHLLEEIIAEIIYEETLF